MGLLGSFAAQIPTAIVCLVGLFYALLRLGHQRAGVFVCAGLGLYLFVGLAQSFLQPAIQMLLTQYLQLSRGSSNSILIFLVVAFAFNFVRAIGLGLVAYAAFVDRPMVAVAVPEQPMR